MLSLFAVLSIVILGLYLLMIMVFVIGWNKLYKENHEVDTRKVDVSRQVEVSLVICCKNEAHNLPVLIDALKKQSVSNFELIWVNDNSTDGTLQILEDSIQYFQNAKVLNSPFTGKKQAQQLGISSAKANFVITTDADCKPGKKWIESFLNFQARHHADLIIAPVKLADGVNIFQKFQQLEFATLVGSGMGAAGAGYPIFCNAANMAFTKQMWLDCKDDMENNEISGDDVFLLHCIKKRKGNIQVLNTAESMVETNAVNTLKEFIKQRKRWASKSSKYKDAATIFAALNVSLINVFLILLFCTSIFFPSILKFFVFVFLFKLITDYSFLANIKSFFKLKFTIADVFLLSVFYPFYVILGISSLFQRRNKW